jgi:hypothetical protein
MYVWQYVLRLYNPRGPDAPGPAQPAAKLIGLARKLDAAEWRKFWDWAVEHNETVGDGAV